MGKIGTIDFTIRMVVDEPLDSEFKLMREIGSAIKSGYSDELY
jgi:hypothetical protein